MIKGDQKISEISAASIIAKVARDRLITKMSKKFKNMPGIKMQDMEQNNI